MEIMFKRNLAVDEKEKVRQVVGFYRGIAVFKEDYILQIQPKEDFSEKELIATLNSINIPIKNLDVKF